MEGSLWGNAGSIHADDCHCRSLSALLVYFNLRHLHHLPDKYAVVTEIRELSFSFIEGEWHTQLFHDVLQIYIHFCLKARQFQVGLVHSALELPVLAIENLKDVADGLTLTRQQHRHQICTVAIGQFQCLIGVVVHVFKLFVLHRHNGHFIATIERLFCSILFFKRCFPLPLEVERIQQIAHGIGVEGVIGEHLLDHLLGVITRPLVDDVFRHAVLEIATFWLGIVERLRLFHKQRL